jgi:hypothetical protein
LKSLLLAEVSQAQISRSSVQKRRFHWSMTRQFWMTDFFNRIGQKQTFGYRFNPNMARAPKPRILTV